MRSKVIGIADVDAVQSQPPSNDVDPLVAMARVIGAAADGDVAEFDYWLRAATASGWRQSTGEPGNR